MVKNMTKAHGKRGVRETSDERYEATLREKFKQVVGPTPEWAQLDRIKDESDDDDIVRVSPVMCLYTVQCRVLTQEYNSRV